MKNIALKIDWEKSGGLVPVIIQNAQSNKVLMLGYMNAQALKKTLKTGKVWFYSRSKRRLWMKGEVSKNILRLVDIKMDCDGDTLLIKANPAGPTCHKNCESCFY
jgi:phosphoribosyl-ATP pyrophosphohydrolase/phosphoribosyl-AMP cyclohydrolase